MKANQHAREGLDDDQGVAVVVGAVLLVALAITALVTVQTLYVPQWGENEEASHMKTVQDQLSDLASILSRMATNRSAGSVTVPVALMAQSGPLVNIPRQAGTMAFEPRATATTVAAPKLLVISDDGTLLAGATETWSTVGNTSTVDNITRVSSFRLRIDCLGGQPTPCKQTDGDSIRVEVTDVKGRFAGSFRATFNDLKPDWALRHTVRNADGDVVYDQSESYFGTQWFDPYWINLLSDEFRFDKVLAVAETPFTVKLIENGLTGHYAITYVQRTAEGGDVLRGSGGRIIQGFNTTFPTGALVFRSANTYYVEQAYTVEHGAVVLEQSGRAIFKVEPTFDVRFVEDFTQVRLTLPTLRGVETAVTGEQAANVELRTLTTNSLVGEGPELWVNLTTEHPELWASFWVEEFVEAGVPAPYYNVATTPNQAKLHVLGNSTDPEVRDMGLDLNQASISVSIEG